MSNEPAPVADENDITQARAAFEAMLPRFRALPADQVSAPNADVGAVAIAVVPVARFAATLRPRFAKLGDEFDPTLVDDLEPLARAARYAHTLDESARAVRPSEARVSLDLLESGTEVRRRILSLVGYWLDDDPKVRPEIDAIRAGHGHVDLARDLNRLAALHRRHDATLRADPRHYRPDDAAVADHLAERIFNELGLAPAGGPDTADTLARAWTLLRRTYDEVAATGRWLLRHQPDADARFPSLYAHRHAARRHPAAEPAAPQPPVPAPAAP
jgi:hypothetical protein